nr:MAG TPA: hypothetical protein [Caudoviricetes sp.]
MLQQGLCSGASQPAMGHVRALTWDAPFLPILRGSGPCVDGTRPSVGLRAGPSVGVSANRSRTPGHTDGTTNTIHSQTGE